MPIVSRIPLWIGLVQEGESEDADFVVNTIFFDSKEALAWAEKIQEFCYIMREWEEFNGYDKMQFLRILEQLDITLKDGANTPLQWISDQVHNKRKEFLKQHKLPPRTKAVEVQEIEVQLPKGWMLVVPKPSE